MEMWCIKIGLRPMIAIFTVIRFSKYTTILYYYCRNYHLHRLGAGKATGTINEEEDEEQEEARYLAMKASASARPAGGVKLPRDVSGQEFLGQDGKYPPYCRCP